MSQNTILIEKLNEVIQENVFEVEEIDEYDGEDNWINTNLRLRLKANHSVINLNELLSSILNKKVKVILD